MSRPPIIHLSGETGWRGGEIQLARLVRLLPRVNGDCCIVVQDAALADRLPESRVAKVSGMGFLHPWSALAVRRIARLQKEVILHAHCSKALETALLSGAGSSAKLIVSRRNAYPVKSAWKYRAADRVVPVSAAASKRLVEAGVPAANLAIVPDMVEPGDFVNCRPERFNLGERVCLILCAAAFSEEKDHITLLSAWKFVEDSGAPAHLVLAGTGPLHSEMIGRSREMGLKNVTFAGWREDMPRLILGADIAVLSSRSEGLSTFLCEAQWCAKPVVATDAGGIGDAVANLETGLLSRVGDPMSLAANLLMLIKHDDQRQSMGRAAAKRARMLFSPDVVLASYAALYDSI